MVGVDIQHFVTVWNVNQSVQNSAPITFHLISTIQLPYIPFKVTTTTQLLTVYSIEAIRLRWDPLRCFIYLFLKKNKTNYRSDDIAAEETVLRCFGQWCFYCPFLAPTQTKSIYTRCCVASFSGLVTRCSLALSCCFGQKILPHRLLSVWLICGLNKQSSVLSWYHYWVSILIKFLVLVGCFCCFF